jgi:hypothetical protein
MRMSNDIDLVELKDNLNTIIARRIKNFTTHVANIAIPASFHIPITTVLKNRGYNGKDIRIVCSTKHGIAGRELKITVGSKFEPNPSNRNHDDIDDICMPWSIVSINEIKIIKQCSEIDSMHINFTVTNTE